MAANTRRYFYHPSDRLTAELVCRVLELVSVKVDPAIAERWTEIELLVAYDWAIRSHLRASDNPTRLREEPWFVRVAAIANAATVETPGWTVRFYDKYGAQIGDPVAFDANWERHAPTNAATFKLSEGTP